MEAMVVSEDRIGRADFVARLREAFPEPAHDLAAGLRRWAFVSPAVFAVIFGVLVATAPMGLPAIVVLGLGVLLRSLFSVPRTVWFTRSVLRREDGLEICSRSGESGFLAYDRLESVRFAGDYCVLFFRGDSSSRGTVLEIDPLKREGWPEVGTFAIRDSP